MPYASPLEHQVVHGIAVENQFARKAGTAALGFILLDDDERDARLLQLPGGLEAHLSEAADDDVVLEVVQTFLHAALHEIAPEVPLEEQGGEVRDGIGGHAQADDEVEDSEELRPGVDLAQFPEAHREQGGDGHVEAVERVQLGSPAPPPGSPRPAGPERTGGAGGARRSHDPVRAGRGSRGAPQPPIPCLMAKFAVQRATRWPPQVRRHSRIAPRPENRITLPSPSTSPLAGSR